MSAQQNTAKRKRAKWGASKKPLNTAPSKQALVVGMALTGKKRSEISRQLELDRETVTRILSQQENQLLVQCYREAVLKIVPAALVGLFELVKRLDRTAIIEVLYGTGVLIDRHGVARIQEEPKRTFASTRVLFFERYGRWPLDSELEAFERTIKRNAIVKGSLQQ